MGVCKKGRWRTQKASAAVAAAAAAAAASTEEAEAEGAKKNGRSQVSLVASAPAACRQTAPKKR
jgi:hypothetical protein